ncbi:MAG: RyR domain-containing protein [Candidatus Thiothrix putei]|uniref:RyR domain-containing protein n=1 Tax=Candidatus Thiothrix putei TaxID=3080811 RepID=A0AA95HFI6_9GAMM|nr:MAG: RyR domain-containing protein [Candidatus Thiothrix putei]
MLIVNDNKAAITPAVDAVDTPENWLARWYFNQYPPHVWADQHGQQQVHLVFAGFSPLVEALMCQYAKISPYKDFAPPVFTLIDQDAETHRQALVARYPAFANGRAGAEQVIAGLYALACDVDCHVDTRQLAPLPITAVVCGAADTAWNLACALHLREVLRQDVPYYVYQPYAHPAPLPAGLIPFGMPEQPDQAQIEAVERNARAVHEAYRQTMLQVDPVMASASDSLKPWEDLAETYREANRRAGDHFAVKLASLGYVPEPGKPLALAADFRLDAPAERRELLSRLEHRSWRYERLLNGWRYGKVRDNQQKLHPSIVLWEDLSPSEREKDVSQMENVRQVLMQTSRT